MPACDHSAGFAKLARPYLLPLLRSFGFMSVVIGFVVTVSFLSSSLSGICACMGCSCLYYRLFFVVNVDDLFVHTKQFYLSFSIVPATSAHLKSTAV